VKKRLTIVVIITGAFATLWLHSRGQGLQAARPLLKAESPRISRQIAQESGKEEHTPIPPEPTRMDRELLSFRELPGDRDGDIQRQYLVKTNFMFPYLRETEVWTTDPTSGAQRMEHKDVIVADHIVAKRKDSVDDDHWARYLEKHRLEVRRTLENSGLVLLSFKMREASTVDEVLEELAQDPSAIEFAEVDRVQSLEP
jgi:hypothetical protein